MKTEIKIKVPEKPHSNAELLYEVYIDGVIVAAFNNKDDAELFQDLIDPEPIPFKHLQY